MFKLSITLLFVATLLISSAESRYPGTASVSDGLPKIEEEALRMATPQKQREMNRVLVQHRSLLKEKMRLESVSQSVNEERDESMENLEEARRDLMESKLACGNADISSVACRSIRRKQSSYLKAKLRMERAKKAVKQNDIGYEITTRKLENMREELDSARTLKPRPSIPVCPGRDCRVVCKRSSCWCVCRRS